MPYIRQLLRDLLWCDQSGKLRRSQSPGELNYALTTMLLAYLPTPLTYQALNDCLGALEGAKLEFYRRVVVPYEQKKMEENGDVYE